MHPLQWGLPQGAGRSRGTALCGCKGPQLEGRSRMNMTKCRSRHGWRLPLSSSKQLLIPPFAELSREVLRGLRESPDRTGLG